MQDESCLPLIINTNVDWLGIIASLCMLIEGKAILRADLALHCRVGEGMMGGVGCVGGIRAGWAGNEVRDGERVFEVLGRVGRKIW